MTAKFYKNHKQYRNLIYGGVWLAIGLSGLVFKTNYSLKWTDYIWLMLGVFNMALYVLEHHSPYLVIKDNVITRYAPFPKQMDMNNVIEIKKDSTQYILSTASKVLKINPNYISTQDLDRLDTFLDKAQLKTV